MPALPLSRLRLASRTLGCPPLALAATAALALALTACAPLQPDLVHVGRAQLDLPPGDWTPIASDSALLDMRPDDVSHDLPLHSRLVGLRDASGALLATLLVQTNATNFPRDPTLWSGACPQQQGVQVDDLAQGSPVRVDCVRYRRRAHQDDYLARSRPGLARWLDEHQALPAAAYSHVSYRYSSAEGGYIAVDVLADQRLLRLPQNNPLEFFRAAPAAQQWMDALRDAARNSVAMLDGRLVLPPFPHPLPL